MFCLKRLIMQSNINICGLFNINLSSLFSLISQICFLSIILMQTIYFEIMDDLDILVYGKPWKDSLFITKE